MDTNKVTITLGSVASVSGLNKKQIDEIKAMFSISNPLFWKKQSMELSTWGLDQTLKYYTIQNKDTIDVPMGQWEKIKPIVGEDYTLVDERVSYSQTNPLNTSFNGALYDYQQKMVNEMQNHDRGVIEAITGAGKCLGKGTPVMLSNGNIEKVENIKVGDKLMGPDSKPREVISLARGKERMYRITPTKGDSWECNESHILSLVANTTNSRFKKDKVYNMSVRDYLDLPESYRHYLKLYRTGIIFNHRKLRLDPYLLGIWLGDGLSRQPEITSVDKEIIDYLYKYADDNDFVINKKKYKDRAANYRINDPGTSRSNRHRIMKFLEDNNLILNKHIPKCYLKNSRKNRLKLLAGLIDSDGHLTNNCIEICTKYDKLNKNILYLSRSLGFSAYSSIKEVTLEDGRIKKYHRISISGDLSIVPTRIKRKQATVRKQSKDVLRTGFTLEDLGQGDYYGFEISGDRLFLLGDFTVTHNTICFINHTVQSREPTLILVNTIDLAKQIVETFTKFTDLKKSDIGFVGNGKFELKKVTVGTHQTLARLDDPGFAKLNKHFGQVIADEVHIIAAETFFNNMQKLRAKYKFGFSVGPNSIISLRGDIFNKGWSGTIEEAYTLLLNKYRKLVYVEEGFNIIDISKLNIYSRGWDGKEFKWKKVNKILSHSSNKSNIIKIKTSNTELLITDSHSIYLGEKSDDKTIIRAVEGKNISSGDIVLQDNGENYKGLKSDNINMIDFYKDSKKIFVQVDLSNLDKQLFNSIITNPKHRWNYYNKGSYGHYLPINKYNKLSKELPKPNFLYSEHKVGKISTKINLTDLAYIFGFYIGDGWVDNTSVVFAVEDKLKNLLKYRLDNIKGLDIHTGIREFTDKGSCELKVSSKPLTDIIKSLGLNKPCYEKTIPGRFISSWPREARINLLYGIIDSDGHYNCASRNRKRIHICTTSKKLSNDLRELLNSLGIQSSITKSPPGKKGKIKGRVINSKRSKYDINFSFSSLIGKTSNRHGNRHVLPHNDLSFNEAKIKKVSNVIKKPHTIYDLEMDGHPSFVANGLLVHNSSTPSRGDGLTDVIHYACGDKIYKVPEEEVKDYIVTPSYQQIATDYNFDLFDTQEYQIMLNYQALDEKRNRQIADYIINEIPDDKAICVLCRRTDQIDALYEMLTSSKLKSGDIDHLTSRRKKADREVILEQLKTGKKRIIISTYGLMSTGIDVPAFEYLIFAAPISSKNQIRQAAGRLMRRFKGKTQAFIVDFVDFNIGLLAAQANKRKKILDNLINSIK